jgi:hypothetical protein
VVPPDDSPSNARVEDLARVELRIAMLEPVREYVLLQVSCFYLVGTGRTAEQ